MKFVFFIITAVLVSSVLFMQESFSQEHDFEEADITWDKGNYRLINGTGTAKVIVTDHRQNENPSVAETVTIFAYSDSFPDGIHLVLYETGKNSGIFERAFSLSYSRSAPSILHVQEGDTAIAIYTNDPMPPDYLHQKADLTATVLIGSTGPPLERAPATNARISDMNGNSIYTAGVDQQILLTSDVSNSQNRNQTFVWIAQVTDDKKKTQSLSWIEGALAPESSFSPTTSWIPENPGKYNVVFFVWESLTNPAALSPPIELDFTVSSEKSNNRPISDDDDDFLCTGTELCLKEKVLRIVDGDTIYISGGHEVRLSLTNTPEIYEKGFHEATKFTSDLCPVTSTVIVDQDDQQPYDIYGRLLGKISCQNKILNSELLDTGHASILTQYCSTSEFADESWAKKYGC